MFNDPLSAAYGQMKAKKQYQNYLSPRRRDRIERKTKKLCRNLIDQWKKMRRYDEEHKRFIRAEEKSKKLIEQISKRLIKLSMYSPDWIIKYRELFEKNI